MQHGGYRARGWACAGGVGRWCHGRALGAVFIAGRGQTCALELGGSRRSSQGGQTHERQWRALGWARLVGDGGLRLRRGRGRHRPKGARWGTACRRRRALNLVASAVDREGGGPGLRLLRGRPRLAGRGSNGVVGAAVGSTACPWRHGAGARGSVSMATATEWRARGMTGGVELSVGESEGAGWR